MYDKYADGTACAKGIGKLCETYSDNGYRNKVSYDSLGRAITSTTTVDTAYTSSTTYDAQGRVSTQTWPTGIATKNTYNTLGALTSINLASNNQVLWQPLAYNERGQMTRFKYGNGVETTTTYAADTGKIQAIQAEHVNLIYTNLAKNKLHLFP